MYLAVAEQQGVDWAPALRHPPKRHSEGIHRAEGVHLSRRALPCGWSRIRSSSAPGTRRASIRFRSAATTSAKPARPPCRNSRSPARRHGVRGLGARTRTCHRRFRAAPQLLLQRAQRLLRRDRQVPRGAQDLGLRDARSLWREETSAALKLRFHAQTAGCSLTWQQPVQQRGADALQAMAAVLGGAQSLHTNSLDEAYALPGEHAVTIALRTQQVLAYESGVANARRSARRQLLPRKADRSTGRPRPTTTFRASTKWAA